jgi:peptide/nickel transport system substrate-binding protein
MPKRMLSSLTLVVVLATMLAACGAPAATAPTAAPAAPAAGGAATAAPAAPEATAAPAAAEATAAPAPATGGESAGIMTISTQQQATWIRNFNPFAADYRWPAREAMYEPLMIYNTVKGEYVPWLGTEFKWSDGDKKLTFTTRDGVKWSDGQPFTAKDVAFTFQLFKDKKGLQGNGSGVWEYLAGVTAPDDKTVEFTFQKVYTVGFFDIATQFIVPQHVWSSIDDPVKFTNETPVATGPFTEVPVFQNQVYEVHKNPSYWQAGKPAIQGFRFPAYPGNDQANLATVNGENDWAANFIPDIQKTYVDKDPENNHYWFPSTGASVMLYVNTTKKPFDDVNVRKAISMAINREQIVKVAMFDYTHPADATGLSDAYPKWKDQAAVDAGKDVMTLNVEKANELLDAAGLAKGADGMRAMPDGTPLTYDINVVSGWTDWVSACQIMAQNLKEIGINASVKTYDFSAWLERVQKGDFDISIGWSSAGANPYNYYRDQMGKYNFRPVGEAASANWHRFVSEDAEKQLDALASTSDEAKQLEVSKQLQMTFVENLPAIPLFPGPQWYEFNTTRFTGFPSEENPYSVGSCYALEAILVALEIKPK